MVEYFRAFSGVFSNAFLDNPSPIQTYSSKLGLQEPNTENERNHRKVKDVNFQVSLNETVYSQTLPAFPNSKTAFLNLHSRRNRDNGKQNGMKRNGSHKQTEEFYEKTSSYNSWIYLLHDDSTSQKLDLDTTTDIQGKFTETTSKPDKVEVTTHNVNTDKTTTVRSHTTKTITLKPNTTEVAVHQANIEKTTIAPPGTTKIIPSGSQTSKVTIQQMKNQAETTTHPIDITTRQEFVPLATSTSVPEYFQGNVNRSEIRSVLQASNSTSSPSSIPTTTAVTLQEAPSSFILTESSTFDSSTSTSASSPMSLTHYHTKEPAPDELAPYEFNISSLLENLQTKENSTNSSTIESLGRSFFWPPMLLSLQSQLQHPFSLKRYLKNIISDTSVTSNTLLPINSVTKPITNSFSAPNTSADISNSATGSTGNFETSVTHIPYIFHYPYPAVGSQGSRQIYKNGTFSEPNFKHRFPQKSHQNNYVADQWGFSHAIESHHHPHSPESDAGSAHGGYSMNSLSKILQSINYQSSGHLFPYAAHLAPGYTTSHDLHPTKSVAIPSVVTTRLILSTRLPNDDGDEPFFTLISHSNKQKSQSSEMLGLSQLRSPPNLVSSGPTRPKLASFLHEDGIKKYYSDSLSESNLVTETINSEIKKFQSILISAAHNVLPQNFTRIEVLSYLVNLMKLAVSGTNNTRRKQGPTSLDVLPAIPLVTGPTSSEALDLSAMPLVTEPASIEVLDLPPIPSVTGPANIETLDLSAISSVTEPTRSAVLDIPPVPLVTEQVSLPLTALPSLSTSLDASPDTVVTLIHTVTMTPDTYNSITTIIPKLSTTKVTAVTEKTFSTDFSSITRVLTETRSSVAYLHDHLKQPQTVSLRENLSTQKKEGSFHRFSEVTTVTIVKPLWQELTESISEYTTNNARPQITAISHLTPTPSFHIPEANRSNNDEANESLHYFSIVSDPSKSRTWIYSSKTSDGASWNRTESFQASVNMILGNKDMVSIMPSYIDRNVLPEMAETDYRVVNVLVKIEATSPSPTPQITISDRPSSPLQRFQLPSNHVHMSSSKITNKGGLNSRLFNGSTSILSLHHAASPMQSFHFISHTSYDELQTPGVGKWNILIPFTLSHKPQFIQHSKIPASENTFIKASHMMHHTNTVSEESPVQTSDAYPLTKRLTASTGSQLFPIWNPGTFQNHHKTTTKAIKVNSSIWLSSTPSTTVSPVVLIHLKKHSVTEENQEDEKLVDAAQPSPESSYHKTYNTQEQPKQTQQELNHAQQNFDNNEKEKYLWLTEKHTDQTNHSSNHIMHITNQSKHSMYHTKHSIGQTIYILNKTKQTIDHIKHKTGPTKNSIRKTKRNTSHTKHTTCQAKHSPIHSKCNADQARHRTKYGKLSIDPTRHIKGHIKHSTNPIKHNMNQNGHITSQTKHYIGGTKHSKNQSKHRTNRTYDRSG
ncbi:serine-rich adhesin for platelets-like [Portunus trituberculatus]|nr:serine-rich adhesin for platelets-like [Portunus trituberculatus]